MNGENSEDIDEIIDFISKAYSNVGEDYLHPKSASGNINAQERIFSYEFYHQMRKLQETNYYKFLKESTLIIEGERIKRDIKKQPDFIIHKPGTNESNYLVIEIKKIKSSYYSIAHDLTKLNEYINEKKYKYGISLIFGEIFNENDTIWNSIKNEIKEEDSKNNNLKLSDYIKNQKIIILWCHNEECENISSFLVGEGELMKDKFDLKNTQRKSILNTHEVKKMNGENSENIYEIIDFISKAYFNVGENYLHPKSASGDINAQERIFSYEFYHQIRKLQESNKYEYKFLKESTLNIEGERKKSNRYKKDKKCINLKQPDIIIHIPGNNENNLLLIEIKRIERRDNIIEDLEKLKCFIGKLDYKYGISLIFGEISNENGNIWNPIKDKIKEEDSNDDNLKLSDYIKNQKIIILWCANKKCKFFSLEDGWRDI